MSSSPRRLPPGRALRRHRKAQAAGARLRGPDRGGCRLGFRSRALACGAWSSALGIAHGPDLRAIVGSRRRHHAGGSPGRSLWRLQPREKGRDAAGQRALGLSLGLDGTARRLSQRCRARLIRSRYAPLATARLNASSTESALRRYNTHLERHNSTSGAYQSNAKRQLLPGADPTSTALIYVENDKANIISGAVTSTSPKMKSGLGRKLKS